MTDNFDIFNLSISDVDTYQAPAKFESEFYRPSAEEGKDNVYRALIRFIPNINSPQNSIIRKFTHYLKLNDEGKSVDSPSTVGEKCPIADLYFKMLKSNNAAKVKLAADLKRRETFFSIVKILKDDQNPDMVGKYKIFKYGIKVKEKLEEEMNPSLSGDGTQIFNPINGKDFELIITKVSGFNNFDKSKFSSKESAILLNDEDGKPTVKLTEENKSKLIEEIKENAPDLDKYKYKPWDIETRDFVNKVLLQYSGQEMYDDAMSVVAGSSESKVKNSRPKLETADTAESSPEPEKEEIFNDDELDDILNDIDFD